tara:strand:+ start:50 stop:262 length:213 start_codon:yes stop_codon:yes gene_type:complete
MEKKNMITKDVLDAYKIVRKDFIENFRPSMSGGLRVARKNIDWFLLDRVERLTELSEEIEKSKQKLKDAE